MFPDLTQPLHDRFPIIITNSRLIPDVSSGLDFRCFLGNLEHGSSYPTQRRSNVDKVCFLRLQSQWSHGKSDNCLISFVYNNCLKIISDSTFFYLFQISCETQQVTRITFIAKGRTFHHQLCGLLSDRKKNIAVIVKNLIFLFLKDFIFFHQFRKRYYFFSNLALNVVTCLGHSCVFLCFASACWQVFKVLYAKTNTKRMT